MKTLKIALLIVGLLSLHVCGWGQTVNKRTITVAKTGSSASVTLNNSYSYAQFISIMGTPDSKETEMDGGEIVMMKYNNNSLSLHANRFVLFTLRNNGFKLNGVVGVGDPASNINLLNPFKITSEPNGTQKTLIYAYITDYFDDMSPICFYTENDLIVKINYLCMDDV
jgi:hypothetical protein